MPIQTIDRGTPGDTGDKFKLGVAFDTCQANDDFLNSTKTTGPALSADDQVALYSGITGKLLKAGSTIAQYLAAFLPTLYSFFPSSVATIAALRLTTPLYANQQFNLLGYSIAGVGGGTFYYDATDTTSADNGGTIIVSGTYRFKRINFTFPFVEYFGALGTGDDSLAFQKAIAYADLNERVVLVSQKRYTISSQLISNKGTLIYFPNKTDLSTNYNGSGSSSSTPSIVWAGAAGAYMYTVKPISAGNIVWGGGSENIEWDGAGQAAAGVLLDNTQHGKIIGRGRNFTYAGCVVSSASGSAGAFSANNEIDWDYVYGAGAGTAASHGVILSGNGSTVPATQQQVKRAIGLIKNGYALFVSETDNSIVTECNAAVDVGGTGGSVKLNFAGSQASNFTQFIHLSGVINIDSGVVGTKIVHYVSEGGGLVSSGSPVYDAELSDYVNNKTYKSHTYKLRDKLHFSSGDLIPGAGAVVLDLASQWAIRGLVDASTTKLSAVISPVYEYDSGSIYGVEMFIAHNNAAAANVVMTLTLSTPADGATGTASVVTPTSSTTATIATGAQYEIKKYSWSFSSVPFTKEDLITVTLSRDGANASDTLPATLGVASIRVLYAGIGPSSSGSGTYVIPEW